MNTVDLKHEMNYFIMNKDNYRKTVLRGAYVYIRKCDASQLEVRCIAVKVSMHVIMFKCVLNLSELYFMWVLYIVRMLSHYFLTSNLLMKLIIKGLHAWILELRCIAVKWKDNAQLRCIAVRSYNCDK